MNIIQDEWLPYRMRDGTERILPITAISNPEVVDFSLPRADFQGAAYQFAIGLLQTVFAPEDEEGWHEFYEDPPDPETLQSAFAKVAHAFNITGDGPLFMQDFDPLPSAKSTSVSGLLIEAPGGNALKQNTDHFVKRGVGACLSVEMAVLALFTLQINAPAGGQGYRTGLRGGGPLTTLVMPQQQVSSLWQKLWLNIINREFWDYNDPDYYSGDLFPWMASTRTSEKKGTEVYSTDPNIHPLHMYWAMPRRIRLEIEGTEGICLLSGRLSTKVVRTYRTKNLGYNYSGSWEHPLTPYRFNPKKTDEGHWPEHGKPGGITYKIWDVLTLQSDQEGQIPARVVRTFNELWPHFITRQSEIPHLWVFGYDMDNMKARGWYSLHMPLFLIAPEKQEALLQEVKQLQQIASESLWQCRTQIKSAWFEKPGDAKGDTSFIDLAFWQRTEPVFFRAVAQLANTAKKNEPHLDSDQAREWLMALRQTATDLFDEYVLSELYGDRGMERKIQARRRLTGWLFGGKPIKAFNKIHELETKKEKA